MASFKEKKQEFDRGKYRAFTVMSAAFAVITGTFLAIYNGVLGLIGHTVWNITLFFYYIFLSVIRIVIVRSQLFRKNRKEAEGAEHRKKVYRGTYALIIAMNVALVIPVVLTFMGQPSISNGMMPSLLAGAYTIYRIFAGVRHYRKTLNETNVLVHELRTINLIDALVSGMSLVAVLVSSFGGTSIAIALSCSPVLLLIVALTIINFVRHNKTEHIS